MSSRARQVHPAPASTRERLQAAAARVERALDARKQFALRPTRAPDKRRAFGMPEREAQARGASTTELQRVLALAQAASEDFNAWAGERWALEYEWFEHLTRPLSDEELQSKGHSVRLVFGDDICPRCYAPRSRHRHADLVLLYCAHCRATWECTPGACFRVVPSGARP